MTDDLVHGWAAVYPHLRYRDPVAAVAWLVRVFGLRERVRMPHPEGGLIVAKLEGPAGGLIMIAGAGTDFENWLRARVPDFRQPERDGWPQLGHSITVLTPDVDALHARAVREGATILLPPTDQPWGLRVIAALDSEGHQWEFAQQLATVEPEAWGALRVDADRE